jgi:hypothetical protein
MRSSNIVRMPVHRKDAETTEATQRRKDRGDGEDGEDGERKMW